MTWTLVHLNHPHWPSMMAPCFVVPIQPQRKRLVHVNHPHLLCMISGPMLCRSDSATEEEISTCEPPTFAVYDQWPHALSFRFSHREGDSWTDCSVAKQELHVGPYPSFPLKATSWWPAATENRYCRCLSFHRYSPWAVQASGRCTALDKDCTDLTEIN